MITYFSLEWKNWSCHPGNEVSSTILIISGSKRKITYGELDGRGNILSQQDGPLQAASAREFFLLVEDRLKIAEHQIQFYVPMSKDI